jgi:hypothetical protein
MNCSKLIRGSRITTLGIKRGTIIFAERYSVQIEGGHMPRVDPYKSQFDYEPSMSGAVLFVSVIAAIIVASLLWANYTPQLGATNAPIMNMQPATPPTMR